MFKININLNKIFFYRSYLLIFCLIFLFNNTAYVKADSKIYLDLAEIQFENERNYKQHQTASQLNINIHLDEEIKSWIKNNVILKGNSGKLTVKILDESIIDSFVQEHKEKFKIFLPKDGIAYKINFKVKIIAENKKNNVKGEVFSIVKGDKTFLGSFSINDRSKAIDELMKNMLKKLKLNLRKGMDREFRDFLTNKYN